VGWFIEKPGFETPPLRAVLLFAIKPPRTKTQLAHIGLLSILSQSLSILQSVEAHFALRTTAYKSDPPLGVAYQTPAL
jgi:hypothetical protein